MLHLCPANRILIENPAGSSRIYNGAAGEKTLAHSKLK